jgi:hypothetical protein
VKARIAAHGCASVPKTRRATAQCTHSSIWHRFTSDRCQTQHSKRLSSTAAR